MQFYDMEMKPIFRRTFDGWECYCAETDTGSGASPEAAFQDWLRMLYEPPSDDAYDVQNRYDFKRAMEL